MVGMHKCSAIRRKIRNWSIGAGRRSSPSPSGVVVDGTQSERVDSGTSSKRGFVVVSEGVIILWNVMDIFLSEIFGLACG